MGRRSTVTLELSALDGEVLALGRASSSVQALRRRTLKSTGLRPPIDMLLISAAVAGFALVTLLLSVVIGAPLMIPTERVSPALGLPAAVPLGICFFGYLAGQLIAQQRRADPLPPELLTRQLLTDLAFFTLFVVVIYLHFHIKMWMPILNPHLHDELYFAIDERMQWLIDLATVVRAAGAKLLLAPDLWYQYVQLSLFILSFWVHASGDRRWHHHNVTALLVNQMIGALAYLVAPAVGPFVFEQGPNAAATLAQQAMYRDFLAVQAAGTSWLAVHGGASFTAPLAAMPSLHVSVACIVSYYMLKARLRVAPLIILLAGWIFVESVVARWHYLVDLPAGVLLAVLVIALTNRLCRGRRARLTKAARGEHCYTVAAAGGAVRAAELADLRPARSRAWPPRVWVLTCHREGDNAQTIGLAETLGWPFEIKRIVHRRLELLPNLLIRATLAGMDQKRSSPLEPPWPDLLIFSFRANENIARWIRAHSGGRTRYCLVGRPWSSLSEFDLIVTTPQLRLPARANVLHNDLPLHRVTPQRLDEQAAIWAPRLLDLPRPYIAVLVGGSSGPYMFDRCAAARLGRQASAMARCTGGSLLVTTSARTSRVAADALRAAIDCPAYWHRWTPTGEENPFFGFLGLADASIVTGESISMITEASASGRPVLMFEFGGGPVAMHSCGPKWGAWPWAARLEDLHPQTWLYALYMLLPRGRLNRTRDLRLVHEAVVRAGRARWLSDAESFAPSPAPPADMERAIARTRALFEAPAESNAARVRYPDAALG
jgi:mitochondrial fission protein ELM1